MFRPHLTDRPIRVAGLVVLHSIFITEGLWSEDEAPLWSVGWVTDTQTPEREWIATLLARVGSSRPRMVLHTGDTRFEWANRCAWREVIGLMIAERPPLELHLAPGNHDLQNGVLKAHLRRAASRGVYPLDTGTLAPGPGYYHNRVTEDAAGPLWPVWNPEILRHPAWQVEASKTPERHEHPVIPYRYVFRRGGIRFIVCDCYVTDDQVAWIRGLITRPDPSSVSILLEHKHDVDQLARYFDGLEGHHNVKLVLTGDHHVFQMAERAGVTFVTGAGIARGPDGESDAFTLWVWRDRLRLDRYVLPAGRPLTAVEVEEGIWSVEGKFAEYRRPALPSPDPARPSSAGPAVEGPDLLFNGDFDNHIWYERYRGWSPSGWYQWFTRGGHAPEHAVGRFPSPPHPAHSGKEYVRIHMWGHAWRGGILQVVRNVTPCRYYRMTAHGFFQPEGAPNPRERIGIDPRGTLADQFSADVTKHPAPAYDEGVGDDLKTPEFDGEDIAKNTVWSEFESYHRWGTFEVEAEALSETITAILYCAPDQRPGDRPIYEMNWDSVSLREVPWPTPGLVVPGVDLVPDGRIHDVVVTVQAEAGTAQVTWEARVSCGTVQVLYRFVDEDANEPVAAPVFPHQSPVRYERPRRRHRVELTGIAIPENASALQVVVLARVLEGAEATTIASAPVDFPLERP